MPTYRELYALRSDAALRAQVAVACEQAAHDVLQEAPGTPHHAERARWAQFVFDAGPIVVDRMLPDVLRNPVIAAAALTPGGAADDDVQFVVNSNVAKHVATWFPPLA